MSEAIALKYIGNGGFLPGVPARDLAAGETEAAAQLLWDGLRPEQIKANREAGITNGEDLLLKSGLYAKPSVPAKPKSAKE